MKRAEQSESRVYGHESYRFIYRAGVMTNNMPKGNRWLVPLTMGVIMLAVMGLDGRSVVQATDQGEMHVDVTITDQGYSVKGHTLTDQLTAITFRNNGTMPHGITSPAFSTGIVKKEGDGVELKDAKGKGYKAFQLEPGKTMTLHFCKAASADQSTMQIPFWCHLHPHHKGEFLVVETRGELGGG
ncbi:MAG: hypothetical protein U0236_15705 [Nitrospira sp.]